MTSVVKLGRRLRPIEEQWLVQKVGRRLHYLPRSMGGEGWVAKCYLEECNQQEEHIQRIIKVDTWYLHFEDEKLASYFVLKFL